MTTINVTAINYPDGSTIWLKDASQDDIRTANIAWRESLSEKDRDLHAEANSCGGAVMLRMPEAYYEALPSSNHPSLVALSK